jgi:hypothetical protein
MRFMMLVCSDPQPDLKPEAPGEINAWVDAVEQGGQRLMGERLRPAREARTVRVRQGRKMITDGPFTESKEVILGFDILECETIEDAIEIAARHPVARTGRIEVRAFWPFEG